MSFRSIMPGSLVALDYAQSMTADVLGMVGLGVALLALVLAVSVTRHIGHRDPLNVPRLWHRVLFIHQPPQHVAEDVPPMYTRNQRIAFVANPTKAGVGQLREQAMRACAIRYLPEPMWFTTTEADPGIGQAQRAIELGADVVVACGGDGTVRAVATAVAHSGASLAIVPMGTGNIFARNLEIPITDPTAALRLAIDGEDHTVDVGWMDVRGTPAPDDHEPASHLFLVIAGGGLDAEMVAGADERLKQRLGWFAYFFAAVAHLGTKRIAARITVDGAEPTETHMRTVMMGNVGRLPGGLQLIPDASAVDGMLDVATLDARGGLVGWTELFGTVVAQNAGIRDPWWARVLKASRVDHVRAKTVDITFHTPQKVQVDGEVLGRATEITARVDPGALRVRVAPGAMEHPPDAPGDDPSI
jgi:YegS/Rv2252/BmrU family lipid kinase